MTWLDLMSLSCTFLVLADQSLISRFCVPLFLSLPLVHCIQFTFFTLLFFLFFSFLFSSLLLAIKITNFDNTSTIYWWNFCVLKLHHRKEESTFAMTSELQSLRPHTALDKLRPRVQQLMPSRTTGRHTDFYPNILPPSHPRMAVTQWPWRVPW